MLAPITVTLALPVPFEGERKNRGVYWSLGPEPVLFSPKAERDKCHCTKGLAGCGDSK